MSQDFSLGDVETRLRLSIDHLLEGVQVITRDWVYTYMNRTASIHAQRDIRALVGRTMMACYPGIETTPMFERLHGVMTTRKPDRFRNQFTYPDGTRRWFDLIVQPVPDGICVISLDITDQLRLEEELRQAHKMEALGQLAGGVAHDFNNQLMVITGLCDLVLSELPPDHPVRQDLTEIRNAGRRSAQLTRQLLTFGRRQELTIAPLALHEVVEQTQGLLGRLLGAHIHIALALDPVGTILGDASQIEHVITNLAVNARDAMPNGGTLTLITKDATLTEADARQHPMMRPGQYAVLTVSDTGHGMSDEVRSKIFEPFFTTKGAGKGTGLGLSTVYGVIRQMGGHIWVYSEPGRGATFKLYFPAAEVRTNAEAAAEEVLPDRPATVLVVEDERNLRDFTVRALRSFGYAVHQAASAEEADALLRSLPIDVLITDIVLPDGMGPDILTRSPSPVRAIFMSGYADDAMHRQAAAHGAWFLEKPFTIPALLDVVRRTLSR